MRSLKKSKLTFLAFVGPTLVLYLYFIIISIIKSTYYSLTTWDAISKPIFTGVKNYITIFNSSDFWTVMKNTFNGWGWSLLLQVSLGMIFAYLIYRTKRGFKIYRTLVFLPVIMAPAAISLLFMLLFNGDIGAINVFLHMVGLDALKHNWLSDANVVFYSVLTPMIYQYIGIYIIIFLAGMQSIPEEIFDSATIDGASSFRIFINIVAPLIWNITFIVIIMITTGLFKSFEQSYIMTMGGPGVSSALLGVYMYKLAFVGGQYGARSAASIIILFCSLIALIVMQLVNKKLEN